MDQVDVIRDHGSRIHDDDGSLQARATRVDAALVSEGTRLVEDVGVMTSGRGQAAIELPAATGGRTLGIAVVGAGEETCRHEAEEEQGSRTRHGGSPGGR